MPIVGQRGETYRWFHRGGGFSTGPVETVDHMTVPGEFSVHVGLSRVHATNQGPLGAVVGILEFGRHHFGRNPADWPAFQAGRTSSWTIAMQVTKGDMTAWEILNVWG